MSTLSPLIILGLEYHDGRAIARIGSHLSRSTNLIEADWDHAACAASFDCDLKLVVRHHFGHQSVTKALVSIVGSRAGTPHTHSVFFFFYSATTC